MPLAAFFFSYKDHKKKKIELETELCGANKPAGVMKLVHVRKEWISLFGHGSFQRPVVMFSCFSFERQGISLYCNDEICLCFQMWKKCDENLILWTLTMKNLLLVAYVFNA